MASFRKRKFYSLLNLFQYKIFLLRNIRYYLTPMTMQNTGLLNWENTWNEKTSGTDLLLPPVPLLPSKLGRELEPLYQGGKTQLLKLSPLLLEAAEVASGNRKVVHLHASELEQPELLLLPARCANGAVLVSSSETQLVPKSLLTLVFC